MIFFSFRAWILISVAWSMSLIVGLIKVVGTALSASFIDNPERSGSFNNTNVETIAGHDSGLSKLNYNYTWNAFHSINFCLFQFLEYLTSYLFQYLCPFSSYLPYYWPSFMEEFTLKRIRTSWGFGVKSLILSGQC